MVALDPAYQPPTPQQARVAFPVARTAVGAAAILLSSSCWGCTSRSSVVDHAGVGRAGAMNVPATSTVRLCSWNIRKLGHGDDKNYPAVARVIEDNCDIVGIVEMAQAGGTYPGYQPLMTALGDGWRGTVTETP